MEAAMSAWNEVDGHLERTFKFADWLSALAFVNRVSPLAEAAQHHPDVELGWGRVTIKLRTHDANAVTQKDRDLARAIDAL
jgi:4a-hydroxytetrahydrobiopterin dehydratase